jgi:predicted small lipoprotein YifL
MQKLFKILVAITLIALVGCKDKKPLAVPGAYVSADYSTNTTTQYQVRNQLDALVNEAKKGRTVGAIVDYNTLLNLYITGSPSLKNITTPYYNGRLEGEGNWLSELARSSGFGYMPGVTSGQGGTYNGYLFDENGLEMEQMVDKGLFGAALYNHAVTLMQQPTLTAATVDQILAIYGAHPDFPNTPTVGKATNPDKFMANYAARRDKNDGTGLYTQMQSHFITLKAAIEAGDDYNEERDEALENIQLTWEKINAGTVINYCHSVISIMSATNVTEADKGRALHAYGECVGFLHGWRTINSNFKQLTDIEIDTLLVFLNAPYNATPESYKFITDPVNQLSKLQIVIDLLKNKFGFTTQEVEDFRKNWVAEQGR